MCVSVCVPPTALVGYGGSAVKRDTEEKNTKNKGSHIQGEVNVLDFYEFSFTDSGSLVDVTWI